MKIKNTTNELITLRGVDFPSKKAVEVVDPILIAKCMAMGAFQEVKPPRKAKRNDKNKS